MSYFTEEQILMLMRIQFARVSREWDLATGILNILHEGTDPDTGTLVYIVRGDQGISYVGDTFVVGTSQIGRLIGFDLLDLTGGM